MSEAISLRSLSMSFMVALAVRWSEWRNADGAARTFDGGREADADESARLGRIEDGGDDADHLAVHGDKRTAGAARIGGGIELNEVLEHALAFGRAKVAIEAGDHARRDRGTDAKRKPYRDHFVARLQVVGGAQGCGGQVVGNFLGADHRQVVVGL